MPAYKYQTKHGTRWCAKINYIDPTTRKPAQKMLRGFMKQKEAKAAETSFKQRMADELESIQNAATQDISNNAETSLESTLVQVSITETTDVLTEMNSNSQTTIGPKMSFADFFDVYLKHIDGKELRDDTVDGKLSVINKHILPFFKDIPIGALNEDIVRKWQLEMLKKTNKFGQPLSGTYLRSIQNQLNAILNYAVSRRCLAISPMLDLKKLGNKEAEERPTWTPEQFARFCDAARENPETYYLFLLYFWCGLRRGEGLALTFADFIYNEHGNSYIKIKKSRNARNVIGRTKNDSSVRTVFLPEFLAEELKEYVDGFYSKHTNDLLFDVSTHTLYDDFAKACQKAGLDKIHIHDLRHSHVSLLIDSKKYSPTDIARQIGHTSAIITLRTYSHMLEPTRQDMANTLDAIRKEL